MSALFASMASQGMSLWEKIATWYRDSLLAEILTYLSERYFTVEFGTYENFSVSSDAGITARNLILALAMGFIIAAILTAYTRENLGGFVRKLLKDGCLSPASAKTLYELGYFRNASIRRALSKGSALRMVVRCCDKQTHAEALEASKQKKSDASEASEESGEGSAAPTLGEIPSRVDFINTCFYIPEELRFRADVRFDNKGSGWGPVIGVTVVTVVVAAVLCWFLPDVLQLADNLISVFSPQ